MNKPEYMSYHRECCNKMVSITEKKNKDYTGLGDDPFRNFRKCENDGTCSVEAGFMVRISDKMSRIQSFIDKGFFEVKDESIEDSILDAANYLILMSGYIKEKKANTMLPPPIPVLSDDPLRGLKLTMKDLPQMPPINRPFRPELNLDMRRY